MLRSGSRFMVASGANAGKMGTVVDVCTDSYPEVTAILDDDRRLGCMLWYSYFSIRNVIEV